MIVMHNRREHPCQNPFVADYRRARAALILHLAADAGVQCHHLIHDGPPRANEDIAIVSSPETIRDFTKVWDFLEGLEENGLLSHFDDVEEQELTREERSWLADYGMCEPAETQA